MQYEPKPTSCAGIGATLNVGSTILSLRHRSWRLQALCGAPPRWGTIVLTIIAKIWGHSMAYLRRRGALICGVSGTCLAELCSQRHILCFCPATASLCARSAAAASVYRWGLRGNKLTAWEHVEDRVLLWTGMFNVAALCTNALCSRTILIVKQSAQNIRTILVRCKELQIRLLIKLIKSKIDPNIIAIMSKSRDRADYQDIDIYSSITAMIPGWLYFLLVTFFVYIAYR